MFKYELILFIEIFIRILLIVIYLDRLLMFILTVNYKIFEEIIFSVFEDKISGFHKRK